MGADEWLRHLNHRQTGVRPILPSIPQLSADEHRWVDTWAIPNPSPTLPVWADVFRNPIQWPLRRLPWHARRGTPARGGARLCRVSCASTKRFGMKSSCRNAHSVTSLYRAGVWNMEQTAPRYHVCFTVTAAALRGALIKPVTVLLSERENRLILIDLPHPPVLGLVHATVW